MPMPSHCEPWPGKTNTVLPVSRAACDSSAAVDLADTTHGTTAGAVAGAAPAAGSTGGTASMITCALVPLMPNDDTPARRARPFAGQGCWSLTSGRDPLAQPP